MNNSIKYAALAVFVGTIATPAMADKAETKGGLVVKTEDGRFEFKLGGRIHFDGNFYNDEDDFDSPTNSTTFFRRARLSLEGKAYGWSYKFEEDFVEAGNAGFREMWIGSKAFDQNFRIGQAKPYRGMEELTSSNEIVFMERPFATASGIYQQFRQGVFVDNAMGNFGYGVSVYNQRNASSASTEAVGYNGRAYFAAINTDTTTLHIGASASVDGNNGNTQDLRARPRVLGRDGGLRPTIVGAFPGSVSNIDKQTTYALELAGKAGPFYAQGEYAKSGYDLAGGTDEDVSTYYVQTSYMLTGEVKPYDIKKGVFKSPKPAGANGAVELKARYDFIKNDDTDAEGKQWLLGVNYYVNPNVRFMVEYGDGTQELAGTELSGSIIQTRAQFSF